MKHPGLHVDIPASTFFSAKTPLLSPVALPSSSSLSMEKPALASSGPTFPRLRGLTPKRLTLVLAAVICFFIGAHQFRTAEQVGASTYRSLPFNYTRDAGHSIPGRLAFGAQKIKGLARNVYAYPGPNPHWAAPPIDLGASPSPLRPKHQPLREIDIASDALPLDAPLAVRLSHWEHSPGGRGPGLHLGLDGGVHEEMELGAFNALNRESCAGVGHQMNTHMPQYASA